jgi:hypothetical protein
MCSHEADREPQEGLETKNDQLSLWRDSDCD